MPSSWRALLGGGGETIQPTHGRRRYMATKARTLVPLFALTATAVVMLLVAGIASASHPRPKGATPISVSVVPAYNACAAPNRTHGPPLAFPSCNPPVQSSNSLTIGSPDAN